MRMFTDCTESARKPREACFRCQPAVRRSNSRDRTKGQRRRVSPETPRAQPPVNFARDSPCSSLAHRSSSCCNCSPTAAIAAPRPLLNHRRIYASHARTSATAPPSSVDTDPRYLSEGNSQLPTSSPPVVHRLRASKFRPTSFVHGPLDRRRVQWPPGPPWGDRSLERATRSTSSSRGPPLPRTSRSLWTGPAEVALSSPSLVAGSDSSVHRECSTDRSASRSICEESACPPWSLSHERSVRSSSLISSSNLSIGHRRSRSRKINSAATCRRSPESSTRSSRIYLSSNLYFCRALFRSICSPRRWTSLTCNCLQSFFRPLDFESDADMWNRQRLPLPPSHLRDTLYFDLRLARTDQSCHPVRHRPNRAWNYSVGQNFPQRSLVP